MTGFATPTNLLCCLDTTTSVYITNVSMHLIEEYSSERTKLRYLHTDIVYGYCARASMEKLQWFVELVKGKCADVFVTHCELHCHALVTKTHPDEVGDVIGTVLSTVNFIRSVAINHRH